MRVDARELFKHVTAEKSELYRKIMDAFAAAKRQFRLHLRPDEVLGEAQWNAAPPRIEDLQGALAQLTEWGNLESQPDTARVASISDFYRARFLYRLSEGGEAVESALAVFSQALRRRAELQSVALEDIAKQLQVLRNLAQEPVFDAAKIHETLRDLVRVFEGLAENAQAFMVSIGRSIELQHSDTNAIIAYKKRLIDYLDRFIGDLVSRSGGIAQHLVALDPVISPLLQQASQRESRDAAPVQENEQEKPSTQSLDAWTERWKGLRGWFVSAGNDPPQGEVLRSRARSAIPHLLAVIAALNERRSGRSDRSADFRVLAHWFADCASEDEAHRLARAAFALNPARHFLIGAETSDLPATTPWNDAPPVRIHPRLREYGEMAPRGPLPRVQDRQAERERLQAQLTEEDREIQEARSRLASGEPTRLSELGELDRHGFHLFLTLLGETLPAQTHPDEVVERQTGDGLLRVRLEPLDADSTAEIATETGLFTGRDHLLTVTSMEARHE
ncbi:MULTISPECIES: TIGR02677 family protein [Bradyrhizobium]|uniref:TIGR02677 family protein n=1 Tax=Bradyrhizobium TaxID=374 RepID=UPI001449C6E4|nr:MULTISPECIES: TIGR02677 family protein [Bradyrhizobium]MCP1929350.1 uncharacterized protein (TIGR02677 family) [Bradyrhizobium elkanii]MCS3473328.1 uncharacterized protein (TIGR02677 family) [Bradyrhizobium elkanii]MCS3580037.1 uncharacterized protein (TIGR02677 family) [Bradyrhizobium elkanii]MCS3722910.1 uncharacterized protein (TIGR02677 family) [Bradyrhizobium elkanii]MCS4007324.1 uncharacterized protein (TIGR02677 family) [Bradyrhizobium elkanii USDA 61]